MREVYFDKTRNIVADLRSKSLVLFPLVSGLQFGANDYALVYVHSHRFIVASEKRPGFPPGRHQCHETVMATVDVHVSRISLASIYAPT